MRTGLRSIRRDREESDTDKKLSKLAALVINLIRDEVALPWQRPSLAA